MKVEVVFQLDTEKDEGDIWFVDENGNNLLETVGEDNLDFDKIFEMTDGMTQAIKKKISKKKN